MPIFPLTRFQAEKLVDFCFDVAKGALLGGFGFTVAVPAQIFGRLLFLVSGAITALVFLYIGLRLGKEIK